jgi:ribose transport system substrate-binding protein
LDTHHRPRRAYLVLLSIVGSLVALIATACSSSGTGSATAAAGSSSGSSSAAEAKLHIAFFGFARSNNFALATFKGVQKAAATMHADAKFFDGNFSAQTQISQIQDATVSGQYQVFIVQANDGNAVVPAVKQAMAAHITVVAEFTPITTGYPVRTHLVPGVIQVIDDPVRLGTILGQLGTQACGSLNPCKVAYLQGNPANPLDQQRTHAVVAQLQKAPNVVVASSNLVGGYDQSAGRTVIQDLLQAHPDINVVIGSSQALEGGYPIAQQRGLAKKIKWVGNGGSVQAVDAVKSGQWFATYFDPELESGFLAGKYGLEAHRGKTVPQLTFDSSYAPNHGLGTRPALIHLSGEYRD